MKKAKCLILKARGLPSGSIPLHYNKKGDLFKRDYEVVNLCLSCKREPVCLEERIKKVLEEGEGEKWVDK